uniref:Uncharacterized protein n=1 Tax=Aureoumbra lagunensis TaxID=44058 RepID=A0A7S3NHA1_9STRA
MADEVGGVDPSSGCALLDRRCTVPVQRQKNDVPIVWVGPNDGRWIRVVETEEVDPDAPQPCPPDGSEKEALEDGIIFAAIASFRDSLCATTVHGLFSRATHPERVRVGVIQQNKEDEDEDCFDTYCALARAYWGVLHNESCPFGSQVSIRRFSSDAAKGPTWARAQDSDMIPNDATFCLRTDSHMAFVQGWDVKQISQWYLARNEFAVISTYVADATQIKTDGTEINVNGKWEVPHLCSIIWQDGHVRNQQAKAARNLKRPKLATLWAAGLSFSKCHAERTVPYDPYTPYIFWGEEFSRTARFFTHGYDIYTPHRTIIAHDYKHTQGDPTHYKWNGRGGPRIAQNKTIIKAKQYSNKRIWSLLGMPGADPNLVIEPTYALGPMRTLQQLEEFTGIMLHNRSIASNRCGNIDWVPWDCQQKLLLQALHSADNLPSAEEKEKEQNKKDKDFLPQHDDQTDHLPRANTPLGEDLLTSNDSPFRHHPRRGPRPPRIRKISNRDETNIGDDVLLPTNLFAITSRVARRREEITNPFLTLLIPGTLLLICTGLCLRRLLRGCAKRHRRHKLHVTKVY